MPEQVQASAPVDLLARLPDPLWITVDGPAGSGKSTVARRLAGLLRIGYLDTGATYRAVTLAALRGCVPLDDPAALAQLASHLAREQGTGRLWVSTEPGRGGTWLDGRDVSAEIRSPEVTAAVSAVSAVAGVRQALVGWQRSIARARRRCVLEGRDTGSVVMPDALVKVWLTADSEVRAARRAAESGLPPADARSSLRRRDTLDASRRHDPMAAAPDAISVDSSSLAADDVVGLLLERLRAALPGPHGSS